MPMSSFTNRTTGMEQAHAYVAYNIRTIRRRSGDPEAPLHPIGGIANEASRAEVRGYVHALRERGVLGGSLYDFATSTHEDWAELGRIPVNPLQSPSLPLPLGRYKL